MVVSDAPSRSINLIEEEGGFTNQIELKIMKYIEEAGIGRVLAMNAKNLA